MIELLPKSVIIIDDDQALGKIVSEYLKDHGVAKISFFDNGSEGWNEAIKYNYDCIILDWRIPDLSGLILLMRFRQNELYKTTPILISSGYISDTHLKLFKQFLYIDSINKSELANDLIPTLTKLYVEAILIRDQKEKLTIFIEKLLEKEENQLVETVEVLFSKILKPIPTIIAICEILQSKQKYLEAIEILKKSINYIKNSPIILEELIRSNLLAENYIEAKIVAKKSLEFFPYEIDKLCMLGEACLNLWELEEAETHFLAALSVDSNNSIALHGQQIATDLKKISSTGQISPEKNKSLYSVLNEKGVTLVKEGRILEGLHYYQLASSYIRDNKIKSKVFLNVALAYNKLEKYQEAIEAIEEALKLDKTYQKAKNILEQLKKSDKSNKRLEVSEESLTISKSRN